jgi:beta-glucosidase
LYIADVESTAHKPRKELKGFAKVEVGPGETKTSTMTIDKRTLQHYDPVKKAWCVEPGTFKVLVGTSSADIHLQGEFRARGVNPYGYGPGTPVSKVMSDERAIAVLRQHLSAEAVSSQAITMALTYAPQRPLKAILRDVLAQTLPSASQERRDTVEGQIYQALASIEI